MAAAAVAPVVGGASAARLLDSEDGETRIYTCAAIQNLCHDQQWAQALLRHSVDATLERLLGAVRGAAARGRAVLRPLHQVMLGGLRVVPLGDRGRRDGDVHESWQSRHLCSVWSKYCSASTHSSQYGPRSPSRHHGPEPSAASRVRARARGCALPMWNFLSSS